MHQLVPTYILQNYDAGEFSGELLVAAMFVDLSGFSSMSDALGKHGHHGSEMLAHIMQAVFEPLVHSVYAQGGFVVGFAGDAITAIFMDDCDTSPVLRCASAAIAIQSHFVKTPSYQTSFGSFPISVKIGLSFGKTIWEIYRSADKRKATFCFRGEAMDTSARAEMRAKPGELWLDNSFYVQVEPHVTGTLVDGYFLVDAFSAHLNEMPLPDLESLTTRHLDAFFSDEIIKLTQRGEFRPIVNVFLDILSDEGKRLGDFMEVVFGLQERYGGFFLRPDFGDKGTNLLIFWGAPVALENDIARALNFLLDLRHETDIPFSAGVSYRLAYAGFIGSALREDYTGYGWGISLAARMMKSARPGEIWVDGEVVRREDEEFDFGEPQERDFKGFVTRQKVFALLGRKETNEQIYHGTFEGRGDELQKLSTFISPLWDGRFTGIMVVYGDAGVGKSRLLFEFKYSDIFHEHHATWALCQSDEIVRQAFNPFRYWLRRLFALDDEADEETVRAQFKNKIEQIADQTPFEDLCSELKRTRSFLAALLNIYWDGSLYSQLDAKERYQNTLIALSILVRCESLRFPLILHIDDAHWIDNDSRDFLEYLSRTLVADESRNYPVAIIATTRPENEDLSRSGWAEVSELWLGGLGRSSLTHLASDLLGGPVSDALVTFLEGRAEGNPFFIEQGLQYLRENELIQKRAGVFDIADAEQIELLSTDIQSILVARLDRLTREVKDVVQSAAVLGREFEIRLLLTMLSDQLLMERVHAAETSDIWVSLNEIRYIFRHALMRDAAYAMQLRSRQRQLHVLAVEAMEKIYADEIAAHAGELAYHAERAYLVEKAPGYLEIAGDEAMAQYQNAQALEYYKRALGYLPDDALEKRYRLHLNREKILSHWDQREEQRNELSALQAVAEAIDSDEKLIESRLRRANFSGFVGDYKLAGELASEVLANSQSIGRFDFTCDAYLLVCDSLIHQGEITDAVAMGNLGVELAQKHNLRLYEARLLNAMGLAVTENEPRRASEYLRQALNIFREENDIKGLLMPAINLGNLSGMVGDFTLAENYYEEALGICREVGNRKAETVLLNNLAWIAGLMGDYRRAYALGLRNLRLTREMGERYTETYTLINMSAYADVLGERAAAVKYAEQAKELAHRSGDTSGEAWAQTFLGHALFAVDQFGKSRVAYVEAVKIRQDLNQPNLETEPASGLARVALALGETSLAQSTVERILLAIEKDGKLDGTDQPLRVYLNSYLSLKALDDSRADAILSRGYEMLNARAAGIVDPAARKMFLDEVPFHREIVAAWEASASG